MYKKHKQFNRYYAWQTRKAGNIFRESTRTYFGSFFTMFVNGIVLLFAAAAQNRTIIITVNAFGIWMIVAVLSSLFFGLPLYNFYMFPHLRDDIHGMVGDTTSQMSTRISAGSSEQLNDNPLVLEQNVKKSKSKENIIRVEPISEKKYKPTEDDIPQIP